jgi:hypothetical protein
MLTLVTECREVEQFGGTVVMRGRAIAMRITSQMDGTDLSRRETRRASARRDTRGA